MQNGYLIAKLRIKQNISQKDMADMLNLGITSYKFFEANLRPMGIKELNIISNYFKISLNTLLNITDKIIYQNSSDIDYKYLKFSINYIRKINRITQKELAKEFMMTPTTISKYEKDPSNINANYLYLFAKKFNISIDYICGKTLKKEVL